MKRLAVLAGVVLAITMIITAVSQASNLGKLDPDNETGLEMANYEFETEAEGTYASLIAGTMEYDVSVWPGQHNIF